MLQCFARFFPEDFPSLSEPYVSWKPIEELSLQTNLHAADLPRQRRLCDVASLCNPSEAALLSDRQEILHLPQLDLYLHTLNVSEKVAVYYCYFRQIIDSRDNNLPLRDPYLCLQPQQLKKPLETHVLLRIDFDQLALADGRVFLGDSQAAR